MGGGGESKYKGIIQRMKDEVKYLGVNAKNFLPILDSWASKMKPLSEDWKLILDYAIEIRTALAKTAGEDMAAALKRIEAQKELVKETQDAAIEGEKKFWTEVAEGYAQGMIDGKDYFNMMVYEFIRMQDQLAKDTGGALDVDDIMNWTEPMKEKFKALQELGKELAGLDLTNLNEQLARGLISKRDWSTALEGMLHKYRAFPAVIQYIQTEIDSVIASYDQFDTVVGQGIEDLGNGIADAFASAVMYGDDLSDTLKKLAIDIGFAYMKALMFKYVLEPLGFGTGGFSVGSKKSSSGGGWLGTILSFFAGAKGGVFSSGKLSPFASGGVVGKPTVFPFAGGIGLMGEKGSEAIMPLSRTANGDLGVKADTAGSTIVNMSINAIDAKSFTDLLKKNKGLFESMVVENLNRNGGIRKTIQGVS